MSLYGALFSGVSGLAAQSSAMAAIADNVTNVNTIGYKGSKVEFQTLVTKQVSLTQYSPGGVQSRPQAGIDLQGLLSASSTATDVAISGDGFFVVNEAANPGLGNLFAFTRAGSFRLDSDGFLVNTGGFYLQGWSLSTFDGNENASLVTVGNDTYMKAYQDDSGNTTYVNDNIIDSTNLKPVNLATIGGTATQTQNIRVGANLPASDPVFDEGNPELGGRNSLSVLTYDSLGNSHNINFVFTKETSNSFAVEAELPAGAATGVIYSDREVSTDAGAEDVYAARGQLEFTDIPDLGTTLTLTTVTEPTTPTTESFTFEFTNGGGATGSNVEVDISSATSIAEAVTALETQIATRLRGAGRFQANGSTLEINQSRAGGEIRVDASGILQVRQSQVNPNPTTGIPTGQFTVPRIDPALKNVATVDFTLADASIASYLNTEFDINADGTVRRFQFTNTGTTGASLGGTPETYNVNINSASTVAGLVSELKVAIDAVVGENNRFIASGRSLEILQSESGQAITVDLNASTATASATPLDGVASAVAFESNIAGTTTNGTSGSFTIPNSFTFNGTAGAEDGSLVPGVRFNSDGTPKYFNIDKLEIQWANGAEDMEQTVKNGQPVDLRMDLFFGNVNTADGLTHLSGDFIPNYINQDGARFGNFAGVSIGSDGIVTALFDNGETRPVAQIPLATFVNPNGMESLTGNSWIETDFSGQPTLREAGEGGAGSVNSAALEASTVDLGTEFTNMITTQRAYSAAAKVITTSDEMLDQLLSIKR